VRELKGFERLSLEPGESRTVTFRLGPDELRYWNAATRDWVVDSTDVDVYVGGDSTASLSTSLSVAGSTPGLDQDRGV
jgi:beta-glucosidase